MLSSMLRLGGAKSVPLHLPSTDNDLKEEREVTLVSSA